jgi:phage-related protein
MAANIIESFFVSLGFEINTEKLDEFEQKLAAARGTVLAVGALAATAAAGIGLFVSKVAEGIDELGDFAELEQVSVEALQEIGYAAQLNGSSLEALKASVSGVNKTVGEAALGIGRGAQTFEKLGMSAKNADGSVKSFDQVLEEVAGKMEGLSRQEQIALAEKLGIDRSLIPLLAKGRGELEALRKEAQAFGVASEEDAQKAGELTDSLDRTRFMLGALGKYIAVGFMPQVTAVLDGFRSWVVAHQDIIKSGIGNALKVVTAIIGTMWDWTVRLADGFVSLVKWLFDFKVVAYAAAAAVGALISVGAFQFFAGLVSIIGKATGRMAAFNATALLIPAIIGAIIIALGLLIDDYVNWKEGNESVIGDLIEQFPWLLDVIQGIEKAVGALIDFWLEQWDTLKGPLSDLGASIWRLVSTLAELLWPVVKMIFTGWAYIMAAVIPIVATLIGWIAEALVGAIVAVIEAGAWLANAFTAVFNGIQDGISFVVGLFDAARERVVGFIDMVAGAIGKVGQLLGLTEDASKVKVAVSGGGGAAQASANNSLNATGGVIGTAGSNTTNSSTVTQTTTISGTTIQINSPDPAKAGEAVRQELERMNKQAVRNGQTAVAL